MIWEKDNEILELQTKMKEKEMIDRKLKQVELEYKKELEKLNGLKNKLNKEEKDVKKLESISLVGLWSSILGTKTMKLNKERDEAAKAQYDYKMVYETVEQIKEEIKNYKDQLWNLDAVERQLDGLYKEKENAMVERDDSISLELKELNASIVKNQSFLKEINEAEIAGKALLRSLAQIDKSLQSAKGWGTWDMFGGGMFTDMMKHSHIEDAQESIRSLKYQANKFTRELRDVNLEHVEVDINIDGALKFFDFFFDGIFSSLAVQDKINHAISQTASQRMKVNKIINELKAKRYNVHRQLKNDEDQKKTILSDIQAY